MNQDFANHVAIITGAGAGIGRATAEYLAARGASVVVNDLNASAARETVASIGDAGGTAVAVSGSVKDPALADELTSVALAQFGSLDIVVNNAGSGHAGPLVDLTDDELRSDIETHLMGTIWLTRAALRVMLPAHSGRIVNTASTVGAFGLPKIAGYAAAKAGIIGFTKAIALEAAGSGVGINAIAPVADTRLADGFFRSNPRLNRDRYQVSCVPPVTAYLASRACDLTGELLSVAAGRIARVFMSTAAGHFDPHADHDQVNANIEAIMLSDHAVIPRSALDEFLLIEV